MIDQFSYDVGTCEFMVTIRFLPTVQENPSIMVCSKVKFTLGRSFSNEQVNSITAVTVCVNVGKYIPLFFSSFRDPMISLMKINGLDNRRPQSYICSMLFGIKT